MPNDKPEYSKYISSNGKMRYGRVYSKPQKPVSIQINRADIPKFLSILEETHYELIEAAVASREKQGFPEATMVLKHIMEKK
jgi:ribosomal protein L25 (general stress protein Ctc)